MNTSALKEFLDGKVALYNRPSFISSDPICIPRLFTRNPDIEIAGFFASIFAWGNRTTIIAKSRELMERMDNSPWQFITGHTENDLKKLVGFKQRTFNDTDLLYFMSFLRFHFSKNNSLEPAFSKWMNRTDDSVKAGLAGFYHYFFSLEDVPPRTRKHIATPEKNSTCKRLNMYLRWMVRQDSAGVDFGIWKTISPAQLICPVDLHVSRVARHLNLLKRKQTDWEAAMELTYNLRTLDKADPVKYDFALFGMGIVEKFK